MQAGAGSGKTTSLVHEILERSLLFKQEKGRWPRLAVTTFTVKAAREIRERCLTKVIEEKHLGWQGLLQFLNSSHHVKISTIDGLFFKFLQKNFIELGFKKNIEFVSDQKIKNIYFAQIKERIDSEEVQQLFEFKSLSKWGALMREYHALVCVYPEKKLTWSNKSLEKDLKGKAVCEFFHRLYKKIQPCVEELICSEGLLAISDIELQTYKAVNERPDLTSQFSEDFDLWFVDEYQDTNGVQRKILDTFIREKFCYYVGDPQQSIYGFRRADPQIFASKKKAIQNSCGKILECPQNYRSSGGLINFFNQVIERLNGDGEWGAWDKDKNSIEPLENPTQSFSDITFLTMQTKNLQPAQVYLGSLVGTSDLLNSKPSVEPPTDILEKFKEPLDYVKMLIQQGIDYKDICILSDKNAPLKEIKKVLSQQKIPSKLFKKDADIGRIFLDALSILKFLISPEDDSNVINVLRSPMFRVADDDLAMGLKNKSARETHWNFLSSHYKDHSAIQKLQNYLSKVRSESLFCVWQKILVEEGFFDEARNQAPDGSTQADLYRLVYELEQQESHNDFNVLAWISEKLKNEPHLEDYESYGGGESLILEDVSAIKLMTIHASKGLEFPYVLCYFVGQSFLPSQNSGVYFSSSVLTLGNLKSAALRLENEKMKEINREKKQKEYKEYKRLIYVALTRCQKGLCICLANRNWDKNGLEVFKSPFVSSDLLALKLLKDLPSICVQKSQKITKELKVQPWKSKNNLSGDSLSIKEVIREFLGDKSLSLKGKATAHVAPQVAWSRMKKTRQGVELHTLLQRVACGLQIEHCSDVSSQMQEQVNYVQSLRLPPMSELLRTGHSEWGFSLKSPIYGLLSGQVDIWGRVGEKVWVVDYKSGASSSSFERDKLQLQIYALALRLYLKRETVFGALLYTSEAHEALFDWSQKDFSSLEARLGL